MKDQSMTNEIELRDLSSASHSDDIFSDAPPAQPASAPRPSAPPTAEDLQAVYDVPVKVQAVLGRAKMDIGELLRLKPGMVVELDRRVGEPVDIFVNNRLIARGEVVLIDNALGITLTEIVRQEGS